MQEIIRLFPVLGTVMLLNIILETYYSIGVSSVFIKRNWLGNLEGRNYRALLLL